MHSVICVSVYVYELIFLSEGGWDGGGATYRVFLMKHLPAVFVVTDPDKPSSLNKSVVFKKHTL